MTYIQLLMQSLTNHKYSYKFIIKHLFILFFILFIFPTELFADGNYLNTPRTIRIGLDLVGKPEQAFITTSNGLIEIYDIGKKKVLFNGKASKLTVTAKSYGAILLEVNQQSFKASDSVRISCKNPRTETITLTPPPKNSKTYRGNLEVSCHNHKLYWISVVDIEDYLKSVVPSEISNRAPIAAIEAQSIAARTYAIRNIDRHLKKETYNLCDTVHCQAYLGILKENSAPNSAIKSTEGKILVYDNSPANTVYHSNCGGYIISSQTAWGGLDVPYLIGHYDGIKGQKSFCEYGKTFLSRQNNLVLPPKSNRLVIGVTAKNSKKKTHSNYGHRVGMCQDGAIGMALIGYSCSNILGFYYPKTKIETLKYAKNKSNKYAPTQVTSLADLKSKGNKNLKEPPVLKELPKSEINKKEQPVKTAQSTVVASNTLEIASAKLSQNEKKENLKIDKTEKIIKEENNTQKVKPNIPEQKTDLSSSKKKDIKSDKNTLVNSKPDNKLKGVLKQVSKTKPNSTFEAIRKTFWRPTAPHIFTTIN